MKQETRTTYVVTSTIMCQKVCIGKVQVCYGILKICVEQYFTYETTI